MDYMALILVDSWSTHTLFGRSAAVNPLQNKTDNVIKEFHCYLLSVLCFNLLRRPSTSETFQFYPHKPAAHSRASNQQRVALN